MKKLTLSVCIPTYNGARWIGETLTSILSQDFKDYDLVVSDDGSKDETMRVIKSFKDKRIVIYKHFPNIGCERNLEKLRHLAKGDILFFMGQDDILLPGALRKTYEAFYLDKNIGAVTRAYYWFNTQSSKPVRSISPYDSKTDSILTLQSGSYAIKKIFESVGQVAGLAYRRKCIDIPFHTETFPTHIYPFASITKKHPIVYLKDITVAVRTVSSQTRYKSSIYDLSPTESWVKMFQTVYREKKFKHVRNAGIEQITTHFAGLIQIKNYSTLRNFFREIFLMTYYHPRNLIDPRLIAIVIVLIIVPRSIMIHMVDRFKKFTLKKH